MNSQGLDHYLGSDVLLLVLCLYGWPTLPPVAMVPFGPWMLPRTMSGSMVLPQQGSMLKTMAHVATEGRVHAWDQVSHLGPCWWLRAGCSLGHVDLSSLHCYTIPW